MGCPTQSELHAARKCTGERPPVSSEATEQAAAAPQSRAGEGGRERKPEGSISESYQLKTILECIVFLVHHLLIKCPIPSGMCFQLLLIISSWMETR